MLITTIMLLYRTLAISISLLPVIINILLQGEIVTSLVYVPIAMLILSVLFIAGDHLLLYILSSLCLKRRVYLRKVKQKLGSHQVLY